MELVAKSKPKNDFSATLKPPLPFSAEGADGDQPPSICENEQDILCESAIAETACTQFPTWKRVFDLACIFLSLPFWLPLTILVMLWIKFASPGPIFYRQERIGYRGRRFFIWKFRTMMVSAETETHERYFQDLMRDDCPMTKLDASGDPRLVRGGRLLRASGVDELPQIVNVLRGEMSLVGPRPCTPHEFQSYQNWQKQRVNAPPGLTGFWQVNGKNKTTFSEMIAMDIFYAKKMSLWLDLKIMLKTIPAVGEQILEARSLWRGGGGRQAFRQTAPLAENFVGPARKA